MTLNKSSSIQSALVPTLLLVIAWLVSACSGSGDSVDEGPVVNDEQPSINTTASEVDTNAGSSADDNNSVENTDETESAVENSSEDILLEDDEAVESNPVVVDPLIQNVIPVNFEITVPYYLSNKLRVELTWGEIKLTAKWVGGQHWTATGEFPTETEHLLTITFYDQNGAVELASYNESFRVGSNATESVVIYSVQFDRIDSDGDGVNNIDELNAGTDPFVAEVSESFSVLSNSHFARLSVAELEALVKQGRPYVDAYEIDGRVESGTGYYLKKLFGKFNINIDIDGNGTVEVNSDEEPRRLIPTLSATRINSGASISWTSAYVSSTAEYFFHEDITNTVTVLDNNLRSFVQETTGSNKGTFRHSGESSANLIGKPVEGSSLCEIVAGTYSQTYRNNADNYPDTTTVVTSVTKDINDPHWRVVIINNDSKTTDYFVHSLHLSGSTSFVCNFVDF